MKRLLLLTAAAIFLNGCIAVENRTNLRESRDEEIDDAEALAVAGKRVCVDQRHAGIIKSFSESARCSKPVIMAAYEKAQFPYKDLVEEYTDKRIKIMQELDDKQIPEDRSYKKMNELLIYLRGEAHIRDLHRHEIKQTFLAVN